MTIINQKYLDGGPDVLHHGSKAHKKVGEKGIVFHRAFIFSKYGLDGKRLICADNNQAHVHITELPETIKAMFGPESDTYQKIANNPYDDGPSIRTLAQQKGNIFGRSGWIHNVPVLMLWNYNNCKQDVIDLLKELEFDQENTVIVSLHDELGYARDFLNV